MNALLIINEADYKLQHNQITIGEYEDIVNQLVDVEPIRHGHWIRDERFWHCSVCNECSSWAYKYCPHCGAKMEVEK